MTFGEENSLPQSFRLLDKAFESGINFFDSAAMYPVPQRAETQGRSEEYLGRWIRSRNIPRDRVVLATKVCGPSGQMTWIRDGPESVNSRNIADAIDNSLLRLQSDYIDLYQVHWPDRVSLLAYSPLTMDILSGKYLPLDGGPSDARLNLFKGRYAEGESRYNLSDGIIRKATELYFSITKKFGVHPVSLAIVLFLEPQSCGSSKRYSMVAHSCRN